MPMTDHEAPEVADPSSSESSSDVIEHVDTAPATGRRPLDRGLLAACFVIAGGIVLIAWGLTTARTGDDGIDRPEEIEFLTPVENAVQVLQQERIVVDFDFGYEAELIVDGIELERTLIGQFDFDDVEPGQQISTPPTAVFDPGNSRIEFQPTEGAQIESFTEGRHRATVIYWRVDEGRDSARSYSWSFDVI